MDQSVINVLVCPECKSKLHLDKEANILVCKADKLAYPIKEGIPVMLVEEAKKLNIEDIKNMAKYIIIPARLKSTRLPGKMLLDIAGKPMIQRVYEQAIKVKGFDGVVIATDAQEIYDVVANIGAKVIMTKENHESGTDRLAEAVEKLGLNDDDIVVNVQGDEPLIPVENIAQTAELLESKSDAVVSTLCEKITKAEDVYNPNNVKVVFDANKYAMYFSRAPIPWERGVSEKQKVDKAEYFRHIGIYGYKVGFLKEYTALTVSPLEQNESLEQLRVLWHSYKIAIEESQKPTPAGVDTLVDLEKVREYF